MSCFETSEKDHELRCRWLDGMLRWNVARRFCVVTSCAAFDLGMLYVSSQMGVTDCVSNSSTAGCCRPIFCTKKVTRFIEKN